MSSPTSQPTLLQRRHEVLSRAERQRAAIGLAWLRFEAASVKGEARARQTIAWTRRIASLAVIAGAARTAWRTLRRPTQPGLIGGAMGTVATFKSLGRLLRLAGWGTH